MAAPDPITPADVLDTLSALLVAAYEDDSLAQAPSRRVAANDAAIGRPSRDRAADIGRWVDHARRLGVTPRQVSSHARLPGSWVLRWWPYPEDIAAAWQAEIHHLDRQLTEARRQRARYARALASDRRRGYTPPPELVRSPLNPSGTPPTKVQIADWFGVSRPTLDEWLADADGDGA